MIVFKQLGRYGRLGNQMFQIASTIGVAIKSLNNQGFSFPYWKNYDALERFQTTEDIDIQKLFVNPLPVLDESIQFRDFNVSWGYDNFFAFPVGDVNLIGHMQSEKYFLHCEDLIRHYFEMKEPENYFKVEQGAVAVHARLTDYDGDYHPIMSAEYYRQAILKMKERGKSLFYIFSDDIEKAKGTISTAIKGIDGLSIVYVQPVGTMEDFYSMQLCSDFIICNSTYSWWAAWLSKNKEKYVIAPANWFGKVAGISAADIYCEGWEVLEVKLMERSNVYSQNGEDGILQYLLSKIDDKYKSKRCVEFGAWDGMHLSNTFNLVKNYGYSALYIEGDSEKFKNLQQTAKQYPSITAVNEYVGAPRSLDEIIASNYLPIHITGSIGDIDVLSIDVDGLDWKFWNELQNYKPTIVIIEINSGLPPDNIMTDVELTDELLMKRGVNFMTMVELGRQKGYTLITHTGNCIFIINELAGLFEIKNNMDVFDRRWQ